MAYHISDVLAYCMCNISVVFKTNSGTFELIAMAESHWNLVNCPLFLRRPEIVLVASSVGRLVKKFYCARAVKLLYFQ